jgi:hypothetical protein
VEERLNRIAFVAIGICLGIGGFVALFQRGFYSDFLVQYLDFGEYHTIVGGLMIALGAAFAWVGVRPRGPASRKD